MALPDGWNFILLGIFIVVISGLWLKQRVEFFNNGYKAYNETISYNNSGPAIHQRNPVQVSILEDIKSKHTKSYNYELENEEYKNALINTFKVPSTKTCISPNEWSVVEPVNIVLNSTIESVYKYTIDYINNTIKESPFFDLPDSQSMQLNSIQLLHDVLISYQSHRNRPSYILTLQLVLYREAKFHAKDVGMLVKVDKDKGIWKVSVLEIWINGVIFEDKIGLFPVIANDPYNTNINLSSANFNDQNPKNYIKKGYEFCASNNIDESLGMQCVNAIDMGSLPQVNVY
jgi:hypothetical protein